MGNIVALDLFAGTGWGVACRRLGIEEYGVELMDEAVATRTANGMETIYRDVWDGLFLSVDAHALLYGDYNLLIASPPCQTFSAAGNGAGRRALGDVLEAIALEAYKDPAALRAFGGKHDPRTALVLTPLAYIWRDRPALVALEQVPTVQPVWDACAEVMRTWGYSVETRVLNAEQYGVPQTRRRSILVAHLGGPVSLPTPTHSRYYPRTPEKLDPGVLKWVSMAEALGWNREGTLFISNNKRAKSAGWTITPGGGIPLDRPSPTITAGHDSGNRGFTDADGGFTVATTAEVAALQSYPAGRGLTDRPSPTITGGGTETGGAEPIAKFHERYTSAPGWRGSTERLSTDEAAALQSYPATVRTSMGTPKVDGRNGSHELDPHNRPAHTVTTKSDSWTVADGEGNTRKLEADEAAALQSYPVYRNGNQAHAAKRPLDTQAPTVHFGQRSNKVEFIDAALADDPAASGRRVTPDEAAALQSYPEEPPFIWCGTKSKVFLQIGNAVPPLLAQHILAALVQAHEAVDLI